MPRASSPISDGAMLDTWGRRNRALADKICPHCKLIFRPRNESSRYCSRPCMWSNNGGQNKKPESWWIGGNGYVNGRVWEDGVQRNVKQHRHIVEKALGHKLLPTEDVHHINEIKNDNDLSNLQPIDHQEHMRLHRKGRPAKRGYKMNLSQAEREARAQRMREVNRARAALLLAAPADGGIDHG